LPLTILLPFVVFGIIGAVLLINRLRPTPDLLLDTPDIAAGLWLHFNPDLPALRVHLNSIHSHALVETAAGVGVVWSFGADPVTRLLKPDCQVRDTKAGVRLKTGDFTAPAIDIPLADPVQRKAWRVLLEGRK